MKIRDPSELPRARLPNLPIPPTVRRPEPDREPVHLSLDQAIRIALENSEVVRVLRGATVTASGSTVYDPAITNTEIDGARARFDPALAVGNRFDREETPLGVLDPVDPTQARIAGDGINQYDMGLDLSKTTTPGGTARLRVNANPLGSNAQNWPLNPQTRAWSELSYVQPLLQGGGRAVNLAPIMLAQIGTERSFYQLKNSVQELVRGVIEGYWALVFARTDMKARQKQVEQGEWAYDHARARFKRGLGDAGDVAQARSAMARFRANLVSSSANVLQREAVLRNVMGLPPSDDRQFVPVTRPALQWIQADWETILRMAERNRPDLIELKLLLEADQQELLMAENQALPRVDATALYRWDHLDGRGPNQAWVSSRPGQFASWQLSLDVSLPLGQRESRAELRRRELSLMRDRANLDQALHNASHMLAEDYRDLAQFYEEYKAFKETREASYNNYKVQRARWSNGLTIYLNVLEANASWGDSVSMEAQSLLQYNTELANLGQQTGTILEEHGIRFTEERFRSIGPMGRLFLDRCYPMDRAPCPNEDLYPVSSEPAENVFDLDDPTIQHRVPPELLRTPPPAPLPP